jgi:transcriptional regulator with XRE-family HTH domain
MSATRIRARRLALGLTQAEVAKRARISRCALSLFECGRLRLSLAARDRIADALDLDVKKRARLRLRGHLEALMGKAVEA